jgi:hypothetical protein
VSLTDEAKQKKREYMRRWREKNREQYNAKRREWAKNNPERVKQHQENYWKKKVEEENQ